VISLGETAGIGYEAFVARDLRSRAAIVLARRNTLQTRAGSE